MANVLVGEEARATVNLRMLRDVRVGELKTRPLPGMRSR